MYGGTKQHQDGDKGGEGGCDLGRGSVMVLRYFGFGAAMLIISVPEMGLVTHGSTRAAPLAGADIINSKSPNPSSAPGH